MWVIYERAWHDQPIDQIEPLWLASSLSKGQNGVSLNCSATKIPSSHNMGHRQQQALGDFTLCKGAVSIFWNPAEKGKLMQSLQIM